MVDTLKNYTFLPWLRQGIAAEIDVPDNLGASTRSRRQRFKAAPSVSQSLSVLRLLHNQSVKTAQLFGPGDVLGINPMAIVKTEPRNWITDFEANYLPYIEFYEEDFPWRFTPAKAPVTLICQNCARGFCLIVLAEDEFDEGGTSWTTACVRDQRDIDPLPSFSTCRADVGMGARAHQPKCHWRDVLQASESGRSSSGRTESRRTCSRAIPTMLLRDCFARAS